MNTTTLQYLSYISFLGVMSIYLIITLFTTMGNDYISKDFIFVGAMLVYACVQYMLNVAISKQTHKQQKPGYHYKRAISGLIPIIMIFIFYLILWFVPGWLSVFSNTLGLLYLKIRGTSKLVNDNLLNVKDKNSKLINMIFGHNSNFLNRFIPKNIFSMSDHYDLVLDCIKSGIFKKELINGSPENYTGNSFISLNGEKPKVVNKDITNFVSYLVQRNVISEFIWIVLIGLGFSVSSSILMMVK